MTNRLTRASAKCPCGAEVKPREGLRYVVGDNEGDNEYVWCKWCKATTAYRRRMCLTRAAHLPCDPFTVAIASALTAGVAATLEKPTDDKEKEKTWQQNTR